MCERSSFMFLWLHSLRLKICIYNRKPFFKRCGV